MSHCRWNLLPPVKAIPESASGYSPLLVQLLHNRGITDPAEFRPFLSSDKSLAADPFLFSDMEKAVERIKRALPDELVCIYGDFDADGITSTAALVHGISMLGGRAIPYIPHRQTEGHGLTTTVLKSLREQGVTLVITVDCGVTDANEAKQARQMGMDIIITDHHSPLEQIPEALAVIDPKLNGCRYPSTQLAGVGVAYKLLQALSRGTGQEERINSLLDLVAIGTIADMSQPLGENRYLISEGLKCMNENPRPGIRALMEKTRLEPGTITADTIGWVIAPCLNAAGRLADGLTGYKLLVTASREEAGELAEWLSGKNEERQRLTTSTLLRAREQVIARGLPPLLIPADREYPMGIAGLVASRLTEEFYHPSIVIHTADDLCHASCRSIAEFDIIAALNKFSHYFSRYGGHAQAAGFTMPMKDLPKLETELSALVAGQLKGLELRPRLDIDTQLTLRDLGGETFQTTRQLAPFGRGNPVPVFLSRGTELIERRTMGVTGEHLKMKVKQGGTVWDCVAFRLRDHLQELAPRLDIVYNLEIDRWNGKEQLRLNILDFKKSA